MDKYSNLIKGLFSNENAIALLPFLPIRLTPTILRSLISVHHTSDNSKDFDNIILIKDEICAFKIKKNS